MPPHLTNLAKSLPSTVPFVGPETQERNNGRSFKARLGANENGFGASPKVAAAMAAASDEMWKYGDPENYELTQALAHHLGIQPGQIAVGEGIDGLLGLAVRLFVEPGATVVTSLGGYPTFNYHVAGFGAQLHTVPYKGNYEDPDALLAAVLKMKPAMVYFANPDNPMSTCWPAEDVMRLIDGVPDDVMLILDEAYGEFAPVGTLPPIDVIRPNMLRMRTFSKAYGLAGMRCGYAIGDVEMIRAFDRVRNHFGISRMTQVAALAALKDQAHLAETVKKVERCRERLYRIAEDNRLTALPSATNFVAINCGSDGAFAMRVLQELGQRGIFVRKPMTPGLDHYIRVSCGPDAEIDLFAKALPAALDAAGKA
ncbi:pyridoxal phosphate-dependent aminotransferase [Tianweitania sp. BSSL-BM11]|uniref:histidinol-phosphate transaminase n=1 Tax=Tianweitania aestuarii TaxID=2814886 RepID=A0ABS5RSG4_9HYPH|nr:pyridoxal phosphate-dependent aminotransferase [Tianweitania aestuarii]MBS9719929.1 pyridoxal phosphate-dependent aminotransferase [Tianweitania aestuarii]